MRFKPPFKPAYKPAGFPALAACLWLACFVLAAQPALAAQQGLTAVRPLDAAPNGAVMLTAVSRDASVLSGGISTGIRSQQGIANLEQIAWLTPSGTWQDLPCNYHRVTDADTARCRDFAASYLAHPHTYTIVSADGSGATVESSPARLANCYSFASQGLYSGQPLERTALAASDPARFSPGHPLTPILGEEYQHTLKAVAAAAPVHLRTLAGVRLYRLQWSGHSLVVVERSFTDFSSSSPSIVPNVRFLFAMGEMEHGRFQTLFWKKNTSDANEQVLGSVVLKSGKEFLVTSVNSPQAQFFRIYAMRNGRIQMVFSGGGSSC